MSETPEPAVFEREPRHFPLNYCYFDPRRLPRLPPPHVVHTTSDDDDDDDARRSVNYQLDVAGPRFHEMFS